MSDECRGKKHLRKEKSMKSMKFWKYLFVIGVATLLCTNVSLAQKKRSCLLTPTMRAMSGVIQLFVG